MHSYLEAVQEVLNQETLEVEDIREEQWEISDEFMNIVRSDGEEHYALTNHGVVSLFLYSGKYYFNYFLDDEEVSEEIIKLLINNLVNYSSF